MFVTPATVIPSLGPIHYAVTNYNLINLMYCMTPILNFVIGYLTYVVTESISCFTFGAPTN